MSFMSSKMRFSVCTVRQCRMSTPLRNHFHTCHLVRQIDIPESLSLVEQEILKNKTDILSYLKSQNLNYSPPISGKITTLLSLFPFSQAAVKTVLTNNPQLLKHDPQKVYDLTAILVECSDYDLVSQEDALTFVGGCPAVFRMTCEDFRHRMSILFSETVAHEIPWNEIMREAPLTLLFEPKIINHYLAFFANELGASNVGHVMYNNPGIIGLDIEEIEKTMAYLYGSMGVSPFRITRSPNLLTVPLDLLKLRYEFVLRCGHYKHPDPSAKGSRPLEASPLPHLILEPSVERFVTKATPGITMEEFFVFTALFEEENSNEFGLDFRDDDPLEEAEERRFNENFKGKRKTPKDKEKNSGRKRQIAGKNPYK